MKVSKIFSLLTLCLFGCLSLIQAQDAGKLATQANKSLKNSAYLKAATLAIQSLQLKPIKNNKAQEVLAESFALAGSTEELRIEHLKDGSQQFTGEETVKARKQIVAKYDSLLKMHQEYKRLPEQALEAKKLSLVFEHRDYTAVKTEADQKLALAKEDAADMHYREGLHRKALGDLENSKTAAMEFKWAMFHIPGYKDAQQQYEEARVAGTKRIALIPFADKSRTNFGAIGDRICDRIRDQVTHKADVMEFTEFVATAEIAQAFQTKSWNINEVITPANAIEIGKKLNVHEIWIGQITQIIPDGPHHTQTDLVVTGSVKVGTKKEINNKGKEVERDVYEERSARVRDHEKKQEIRVNGAYEIIDVISGQASERESFSEAIYDSHSWRQYVSGEQRVAGVLGSDRQLTSHADLLNNSLNRISQKIANVIDQEARKLKIPVVTQVSQMMAGAAASTADTN